MPDPAEQSSLNKSVNQKQASLQALMARRKKAREKEADELEKKRESAGYTKTTHVEKNLLKRFTPKQYAIGGGGLVVLLILYQLGSFVYESLLPSQAMDAFQAAVEQQNYPAASEQLETYLRLQPDDWEAVAMAGEYYLEIGNNTRGRTMFARLTSDSPLAKDADILFMSAISTLPNTQATNTRIGELLVTVDNFTPALLVRAILAASEHAELAQENIDLALIQIDRLNSGQETYKRYQKLLGLFFMTICREGPDRLDNAAKIPFTSFPNKLYREHDMLLYGADANVSANFCGLFPSDPEWLEKFQPDLEALTYFIQTYIRISNADYPGANESIGQSLATEYLPYASFLNGALLLLDEKFGEAISAFQRSGGSDDVATQSNIAIAYLLSANDEAWGKAEIALSNLNSLDNANLLGLNNRGVLSLLQGRLVPARDDFIAAVNLEKSYLPANYNLAVVDYLENNFTDANQQLSNLRDNFEQLPGLYYYKGRANLHIGDTERALSDFRNALTVPGYNVLAEIALGDYYNNQALTQETALDHYRNAYEANPNNYEAAIKYAGAQSETEDPEAALAFVEELNSEFSEVLTGGAKAKFEELYKAERARILYKSGSPDAEEELRKATNELTDDELRVNTSILFVELLLSKTGDAVTDQTIREALDVTRTILPLSPKNIQFLLLRSRALAKANDLDQAMTFVDTALDIDARNADALMTKADILTLDQRWDAAVESYKEAFEANPIDPTPISRAIALLEEQKADSPQLAELRVVLQAVEEKNEEIAKAAASDGTEDVDLKVGLSDRITDPEEVAVIEAQIEQIEELINTDKIEPFAAYVNLGALYTKIGNIDQALINMFEAAESPDIPPEEEYKPYLNISQLQILKGNYQASAAALTRVIELKPPELSRYFFLRGNIREKFDTTLAIEDYDQVIALQPNSFQAFYRRGVNKLRLEEVEGAIDDLTSALKIDPERIEVYQARRSAFGLKGDRQSAAKDAEMINILSARQAQ